jgi:PAS domain S-box-containing protein
MDYATGTNSLMVFYLIPICFTAWFAGRGAGLLAALGAATAWYVTKALPPLAITNQTGMFWNFLQRLGVFGLSAIMTAEVGERKRAEEALRTAQEGLEVRVRERTVELARANAALQGEIQERCRAEANLKLLNETLEERVTERNLAAEQRTGDLTRSERALKQQTGILQSILNSMGDGVMVANGKAEVVLFNPAAERLIRAGMGQVAPQRWMEHFETFLADPAAPYSAQGHPLLRALHGEVIRAEEFVLRGANGTEPVWLTVTGRPLIDEKGKVQGGVAVFSDITSRKEMEKQIAEVSDREQRRIGQDLHDGLCQHLVSVAFAGELLRENLARQRVDEAAQAEAIVEMVNEGITEARHLARGLYPVRLEVDGLASALEELTVSVQSRTGIGCQFACEEPVYIADEAAASNLYRIAQEAVNNAVKHADCKNISVGLGVVEDEVTLTVKDDGVGFPETPDHREGMGLFIMNYRAKMIGASLEARTGAGGGTIVICSFHIRDVVSEEHAHAREN